MKRSDRTLASVTALKAGQIATLYRTTAVEAEILLDRCGVDSVVLGEAAPKRKGGAFGDPLTNARTERASVDAAIAQLESEGWSVRSVESERQGFDLDAHKGPKRRHVEVKGVSGPDVRFIITPNELRVAEHDPHFELWCVTNALDPRSRAIHRFTGPELLRFDLRPTAFLAVRFDEG